MKKFVQSASYLPRFISLVVDVGMVLAFLDPYQGIVNSLIKILGGESINFINENGWFRTIYIASDIWQYFGWNSIIYYSALTAINPALYESANIDGATRFQKMRYITLPCINSTIVILLILTLGSIMSVRYEKIILLYNPSIYDVADVIQTYTYRLGILRANYSYASAVGLFNSVVNFFFLVFFNWVSRKLLDTSLF